MLLDPANEDFERDFAAYDEALRSFATARLDVAEVDDVLQEVWTRYAATIRETTIDQPRAWLYRVLRNRITDHYRREAGRPAFQDLTPELGWAPDDTDFPDPDGVWAKIEAALAQLPPAQRLVFERNELDGDTLRSIAAATGVPLKTVISRKGYARRRLRVLLRGLYDDYFGID